MNDMVNASKRHAVQQYRCGLQQQMENQLAEEVAVALVYNGIQHVVLMATPMHLTELAYGFSFSEGIIEQASDIYELSVHPAERGIVLEITLCSRSFNQLKQRRRQLAGRTGCGICGIEALDQLNLSLTPLKQPFILDEQQDLQRIQQALQGLQQQQPLYQATGAVHAAAYWCADMTGSEEAGLSSGLTVFEDVGRHNALDKLIGWQLLHPQSYPQLSHAPVVRQHVPACLSALLLTSRLSYELIQKAARASMPTIAGISAPTSLALQMAQQANINLLGFVRNDRLTLYHRAV
jgi:FdhD protein